MADERSETLDLSKVFTWSALFRTFQVALDPKKLVFAAAGIFVMAMGWWLISLCYYNLWTPPKESDPAYDKSKFAKPDLTEQQISARAAQEFEAAQRRFGLIERWAGPNGIYRTLPWNEERGPNPFLFATRVIQSSPAERSELISRFLTYQIPVLIEPLIKYLSPVVSLFDSSAGLWNRVYLLLMISWALLVWAFFGGVITRLAVLQLTGQERIYWSDAVRFVASRYLSYFSAPLVPLGLIAAILVGCIFLGLLNLAPGLGDFYMIVAAPLYLGAGIAMAILLVGLIGYPMMYATISAEGSDTFDAISRSYNYVFQCPWHYLWYALVAIFYGAIVTFVVLFMSSMMVYLGKLGMTVVPGIRAVERDPEFLMIYTPTSFGWRELLLQDKPELAGVYDPATKQFVVLNPEQNNEYLSGYYFSNKLAAALVSTWVTLLFMLTIGFSYSYFWTASTLIYLLMRQKVDEQDLDEVYVEEEESEEPIAVSRPTPMPNPPGTQMVEAPTLRTPTPATPTAPPAPPVAPPPPATTPSEATPSAATPTASSTTPPNPTTPSASEATTSTPASPTAASSPAASEPTGNNETKSAGEANSSNGEAKTTDAGAASTTSNATGETKAEGEAKPTTSGN